MVRASAGRGSFLARRAAGGCGERSDPSPLAGLFRGPFRCRSLQPVTLFFETGPPGGAVRPRKAYVALASFFTATRWASAFLIASVLQDASCTPARRRLSATLGVVAALFGSSCDPFIAAAALAATCAALIALAAAHCVHPRRSHTPALRINDNGQVPPPPLRPHAPHPTSARAPRPAKQLAALRPRVSRARTD